MRDRERQGDRQIEGGERQCERQRERERERETETYRVRNRDFKEIDQERFFFCLCTPKNINLHSTQNYISTTNLFPMNLPFMRHKLDYYNNHPCSKYKFIY